MGGAKKAAEFIRLFMAPGVAHCGGGTGPTPTGQLEALLAWVEEGKAPERILATRQQNNVTRSRPVCAYPLVPKYTRQRQHRRRREFRVQHRFLTRR